MKRYVVGGVMRSDVDGAWRGYVTDVTDDSSDVVAVWFTLTEPTPDCYIFRCRLDHASSLSPAIKLACIRYLFSCFLDVVSVGFDVIKAQNGV